MRAGANPQEWQLTGSSWQHDGRAGSDQTLFESSCCQPTGMEMLLSSEHLLFVQLCHQGLNWPFCFVSEWCRLQSGRCLRCLHVAKKRNESIRMYKVHLWLSWVPDLFEYYCRGVVKHSQLLILNPTFIVIDLKILLCSWVSDWVFTL